MAVACADSFKRAASAYIIAGTVRTELPEGLPAPSDERFGDLAVCASNLAFAIEIYLKTLRTQLGLPVREKGIGHDLASLYDGLPAHIRKDIEERYERGRTTPTPTYASVTLSFSRTPVPPVWPDSAAQSMQLPDVLRRSKDLFVTWRYVFEVTEPDEPNSHRLHTFEYLLLLFACEAISAVITRNW
jgi:hypothetical protein